MYSDEEQRKIREEHEQSQREESPVKEPRLGEVGRDHPVTPPGMKSPDDQGATDAVTWRQMDELGGDNENHSRHQGIGYGRGSSKGSRNDHMWNSTDDDH